MSLIISNQGSRWTPLFRFSFPISKAFESLETAPLLSAPELSGCSATLALRLRGLEVTKLSGARLNLI
jgi:hypothetical protein